MKYFLTILGVLTLCVVGESVKRLNVFTATGFEKLIYMLVHESQSHKDDKHPITDPEIKEELCDTVTASEELFNPNEYERINMYEIYEELKTKHERIFNELYAEPSDSSVLPAPGRDKVYLNETQEIRVLNPWNGVFFNEYMFVCLIRRTSKEGEKILQEIYVSGEYDVRDFRDAAGPYKAGRFIFLYNDYYKNLTPHGFVEEPAKVLSSSVAYLEKLFLHRAELSIAIAEDANCPEYLRKLSGFEMDRFCNVVLNSAHYDGKHKYRSKYPSHYAEDRCVRMNVSFQTAEAQRMVDDKLYKQWTVRCRIHNNEGKFVAYHISRADEPITEVFVYRETSGNEIVLENLSTNVRFVAPSRYE